MGCFPVYFIDESFLGAGSRSALGAALIKVIEKGWGQPLTGGRGDRTDEERR